MKDINKILSDIALISREDKKAMERFNRQSIKMERLIDELERACGFRETNPQAKHDCFGVQQRKVKAGKIRPSIVKHASFSAIGRRAV